MQDFERLLTSRSAGEYAEFLLPHVKPGMAVLDCGCGPASITCGIAERLHEGLVIGFDLENGFHAARGYAETRRLSNLTFVRGDINSLPFRAGTVDAVLAHSLFEILRSPSAALAEIQRVLRSDGVVGIAAVDYSGLLLSGPSAETLWRFYRLREQYWERCLHAEPRGGRHLRSLLFDAGFRDVRASARYVSYGSREAVARFGEDRARECEEQSFADGLIGLALTDQAELRDMAIAWRRWGPPRDRSLHSPGVARWAGNKHAESGLHDARRRELRNGPNRSTSRGCYARGLVDIPSTTDKRRRRTLNGERHA